MSKLYRDVRFKIYPSYNDIKKTKSAHFLESNSSPFKLYCNYRNTVCAVGFLYLKLILDLQNVSDGQARENTRMSSAKKKLFL